MCDIDSEYVNIFNIVRTIIRKMRVLWTPSACAPAQPVRQSGRALLRPWPYSRSAVVKTSLPSPSRALKSAWDLVANVRVAALAVVALLVIWSAPAAVALPAHLSLPRQAPASSTKGAFAFVSNFEDGQLDGWSSASGAAPSVSTSVTYSGEYSLKSSASGKAPQVDVANQGFVAGDSFVSFQVAVDASKGAGYFGLYASGQSAPLPVALVGVSGGVVYAGPDLASLQAVGPVPTGTAYPSGWVYISANVYDASTPSNPGAGWVMQVFVDQSVAANMTVGVPQASSYSGAVIETAKGTAYYSDVVVSTYEIPISIPGYNNMEGYGQGSGLLVNLLPAFTNLSAQMNLASWDTPQQGILSFQINAMNYYGTTTSTCVGFFQLGVDLNPNGYISPWYVPGKNCFAHYFIPSQNPAVQPGIYSGPGTHLKLSIVDDLAAGEVVFTIIASSPSLSAPLNFTAAVPYSGTQFYGTYTQLEFQPCCNLFPIQDYQLNGELYDMQVSQPGSAPQSLPASYMLPFTLNAPTSWDFTYYQGPAAGYQQIS